MQTIAIKDFRKNLSQIANQVSEGKSFTVFRRSKPAFEIHPPKGNHLSSDDINKVLEKDENAKFKTLVDFTEEEKSDGISPEMLLKILKKIDKK